ncbi:hypothetical protein FE257_001422 [Aspergillus nanangensis]|uniref:WD repeat protein n=1 Tax=Aspergillus nanangensis TaxID=2582783 RepID=A0AAD4CDS4_ASPNN|nr:hypothetical protein FE257_001422 [Aspergillus nanangensis]
MAEDSKANDGRRASRTVPAIVTVDAPSSTSLNNKQGDLSPMAASPGLLHTAQSFPIGSVASDVASGSSGNQHEAKKSSQTSRPAQSTNGAIGVGGKNASSSSPTVLEANTDSSAIDPLSQHIIKRTNTQKSIPLKLLGRASHEAEAGGVDLRSSLDQGPIRGDTVLHKKPSREKKKGVSFLSRIIPGKKKDQFIEEEDDVSEPETARMDADASSQPIGFFPRFPRPPKYVRARAWYKKEKTFNRVFVAQELEGANENDNLNQSEKASTIGTQNYSGSGKAIWALVFSNDGRYLAAAGQDGKVRVWAVISSPEERHETNTADDGRDRDATPQLKAPVFKTKPLQVYEGHTGSVLDLSWSKNNFLLSSSMDKTVRLWHITRPECLCCFKHSDFVTSIQFHPRDDRFFLAGSLDTKLRLWSIPDKSVAFVANVPDMITAVAFTPDGRHSIAGCLNGMCNIYETDGLKALTQIHVRSARGRNAKGSKITGIDTISVPCGDPHGDVKLLITSNDSRIRMYNFRDRTLEAKFRGNENTCSQIRATFSDDGKHVICGSEDRRTYIWPIGPVEKDADKRAVEILDTQSAMVTVAVMATSRTKQALGLSEDPIYDICNPPPVTLMNQAEAASKEGRKQHRNSAASKLAQESPTYLARTAHPDGNIIITADYSGRIKVLRQDCAYQKRRYEAWDNHSTISRRLLRRTNSARHSIASSIGRESSHKTPSERIISWRNSVIGHHHHGSRTRTPSPHRFPDLSRYSSPGGRGGGPETRSGFTISPPQSAYKPSMDYKMSLDSARSSAEAATRNGGGPVRDPLPTRKEEEERDDNDDDKTESEVPPSAETWAAKNREDNPLWLQGDHSYAFYNKITRDALAVTQRKTPTLASPNRLSVPLTDRQLSSSGMSILSSDDASSTGEADEGDVLRCENCGGTNFRATKGRSGKQRLNCVRCHLPIN